MIPEVFVDGIGRIAVSEGMVRIEFVTRSASETDENGRPRAETRQRLIMTPLAFLQGLEVQQNIARKLEAMGRKPAAPSGSDSAAAGSDKTGQGPARSPNFSTD